MKPGQQMEGTKRKEKPRWQLLAEKDTAGVEVSHTHT